jgi:hypothetical protein
MRPKCAIDLVVRSEGLQPSQYATMGTHLHVLCLVTLGLWLIDNANVEQLAGPAGNAAGTIMLTLTPLRTRNITGSPVNPIALF